MTAPAAGPTATPWCAACPRSPGRCGEGVAGGAGGGGRRQCLVQGCAAQARACLQCCALQGGEEIRGAGRARVAGVPAEAHHALNHSLAPALLCAPVRVFALQVIKRSSQKTQARRSSMKVRRKGRPEQQCGAAREGGSRVQLGMRAACRPGRAAKNAARRRGGLGRCDSSQVA